MQIVYAEKDSRESPPTIIPGGPYPCRRFFTLGFAAGAYTWGAPAAGGSVSGVTGPANWDPTDPSADDTSCLVAQGSRSPYGVVRFFLVESAAAFAADADLETDTAGRAVEQSSGIVLAVALEAATGAGQVVLARWA